MIIRMLGAVCVISGCGGFGILIARNVRKEISTLRQFARALEFMEYELNYRMTPLPQLCRRVASVSVGCVQRIFQCIADELEHRNQHDVASCISIAMKKCPDTPKLTADQFLELGLSLGEFDLEGQIKSIQAVRTANDRLLNELYTEHKDKLRSYKTLGLCAGLALVILFI